MTDAEIIGRFAVNLGGPVAVAGDDLSGDSHFGADTGDVGDFAFESVGIVNGQCAGAAQPQAHTAMGAAAAGGDLDHVLSEAGDLRLDLRFGAIADAYHGDDRADTDDDAQRGQSGAQSVLFQGAQSNFNGGRDFHGGAHGCGA